MSCNVLFSSGLMILVLPIYYSHHPVVNLYLLIQHLTRTLVQYLSVFQNCPISTTLSKYLHSQQINQHIPFRHSSSLRSNSSNVKTWRKNIVLRACARVFVCGLVAEKIQEHPVKFNNHSQIY